ncbi:hypothetical protein C0992_011432 [Termitomyces sp. T32_za158]|nr:hypothetical protein C0992_011432 [Termitomyces sp. T32_za158]
MDGEELVSFFCRALYDYEAQDGSALSFMCGDVMEVLTREPSGWWDGLLRNERGWFPSNYVEVISDDETVQAFLAAESLAAGTSALQPPSISSMVGMPQTVVYQVDQEANEKWLNNEILASRKKSFSDNTTSEKSQISGRWISGIRSDGQIFYVNTEDGRRLVSQTSMSSLTRISLGRNGSMKPTEIKQDITGPGILRRPSTPESWEKKLHEDEKSHFYYKKGDGKTMGTCSEGADNASSRLITSPLQQKATHSNIRHSGQYSNDSNRHSRQTPVRTQTKTVVLSERSSGTRTRPIALANALPEYKRIAWSLQQTVVSSLPEGITELSTTAEFVIQAILNNIRMNGSTRRPEEDVQLNDLVCDVVVVVRNLLYALAVPTLQIPQNVLPREVRDLPLLPRSPLKPAQRKVTATLSRLVLSARAIHYDTGLLIADILSRLEIDVEGLKRDVFAFIRQAQELKHSSKSLPRHRYPKRLRGAFDTQNVGPGLIGAGAAGRWKGFGWISLDEAQVTSRRTLGLEVISHLRLALNHHKTEFQSFLHILQTPRQSLVEQVRLSGRELMTRVSSFVNCVSDIHVARHVDVDGLLQDGTGPYGLTIESAQRLVRKLEAVTQAVNDDTSAFLLTLQSVPEFYIPQHRPQRNHVWHRLVTLASVLTTNMTVLLETLCALFSLGHEQAKLSFGDYDGSIEWRTSRLSLRHSSSTKSVEDSADILNMTKGFKNAPKDLTPYDRNSDTSGTLESSREYNSANNTSPSEDEGELKARLNGEESFRSNDELFYNRKSPAQDNGVRKGNKSLGDEYGNEIALDSDPWYLRSNYNKKDFLIAHDNTVKGGTLPALVERLTAHDKVDTSFNRAFLMTFKSFMTVDELVNLLFARFRIEPPPDLKPSELEIWKRHKQQLVQLRVLNTFITILKDDSILETEDLHILGRLKAFISSDKVSRIGAAKEVLVYIERLTRKDNTTPKAVMRSPPPPPIYPKTTKELKLTNIKPLELARQLTLMESNLYRKIKSLECMQRAREQKVENMDNIANVIQMSNRVSSSFMIQISLVNKEDRS